MPIERDSRWWRSKPLRRCLSLHFCEMCGKDITLNEQYYDGGYGHRAHEECVDKRFVCGQ